MPLVEIKYFNALIIDIKTFFDQPVKKLKQEIYETLEKEKKCYNARNLLDYLHDQKYEKLTDRDLSRQTNTSIPQQINFEGKLEEHYGATMFFIAKKQQKQNKKKKKTAKNYFNPFLRSIYHNRII